jgi:hypothetical protein
MEFFRVTLGRFAGAAGRHLDKSGVRCRRIEALEQLLPRSAVALVLIANPVVVVCGRCCKLSTMEHHGGRWCTNGGCFGGPPDPTLLPSMQPGYRDSPHQGPVVDLVQREQAHRSLPECG